MPYLSEKLLASREKQCFDAGFEAGLGLAQSAPELYDALRVAEKFIEEELEVRRSSFLPSESPYIDEAVTALAKISAAIAKTDA